MALEVEDGSGKANAEAYLSVAGLDAYLASHGYTTAATEAQKEVALRKATEYLDGKFGERWTGYRRSRTQALDWPRLNGRDDDGWPIASDEIPKELMDATAEAAYRALSAELEPDLAAGQASIASESKRLGPIGKSVTYVSGGPAPPKYRKVEQLLAPLLELGTGVHRLVRA